MKKKNGKAAVRIGGFTGATMTGGTLTYLTSSLTPPLANLGGYATAQIVAGGMGTCTGISIGGPALSSAISAIGGPIVAGTILSGGGALVTAGATFIGYKVFRALWKRY